MTCSLPCFVLPGAPGALGIATTSLTAPGTDKLTPLGSYLCQFYVDCGIKAELGTALGWSGAKRPHGGLTSFTPGEVC